MSLSFHNSPMMWVPILMRKQCGERPRNLAKVTSGNQRHEKFKPSLLTLREPIVHCITAHSDSRMLTLVRELAQDHTPGANGRVELLAGLPLPTLLVPLSIPGTVPEPWCPGRCRKWLKHPGFWAPRLNRRCTSLRIYFIN